MVWVLQKIVHGMGIAENFAWHGYCRRVCMEWVLLKILHGMGIAENFAWYGYCRRYRERWDEQEILHVIGLVADFATYWSSRRVGMVCPVTFFLNFMPPPSDRIRKKVFCCPMHSSFTWRPNTTTNHRIGL
jgi:hypothetical protein